MRCRPLQSFLIALTLFGFSSTITAAPSILEQLTPRKSVSADPNQEYKLAQSNGPWLVMATSFTGEEGKAQAQKLVHELRSKYHLPAFYYGMEFQLEDLNPGRGIDEYGGPIKRRYNRSEVEEHAVLVGEFPAIDAPEAQKILQQIKHVTPDALKVDEDEESAQSMALVREIQNQVREKVNPKQKRGPMGHAFLTRNPMLPKEYFVPQGVDAEVAKWNERVEHSLMKCPGKFSIRVATFRGRVTFESYEAKKGQKQNKSKKKMDPLEEAAYNAHEMTLALRAKGWEAYEFHDRQESYVTVGSFDNGTQLADGRIELADREAQIIAQTFGAATPNNVFERPATQDKQLEELQKQRFNNLFAQRGDTFDGLHPKRFIGLPFDIVPEPVNVPRKSISSTYARSN
jgi:hypothetical protein